jgi:hypothetical protein
MLNRFMVIVPPCPIVEWVEKVNMYVVRTVRLVLDLTSEWEAAYGRLLKVPQAEIPYPGPFHWTGCTVLG